MATEIVFDIPTKASLVLSEVSGRRGLVTLYQLLVLKNIKNCNIPCAKVDGPFPALVTEGAALPD